MSSPLTRSPSFLAQSLWSNRSKRVATNSMKDAWRLRSSRRGLNVPLVTLKPLQKKFLEYGVGSRVYLALRKLLSPLQSLLKKSSVTKILKNSKHSLSWMLVKKWETSLICIRSSQIITKTLRKHRTRSTTQTQTSPRTQWIGRL